MNTFDCSFYFNGWNGIVIVKGPSKLFVSFNIYILLVDDGRRRRCVDGDGCPKAFYKASFRDDVINRLLWISVSLNQMRSFIFRFADGRSIVRQYSFEFKVFSGNRPLPKTQIKNNQRIKSPIKSSKFINKYKNTNHIVTRRSPVLSRVNSVLVSIFILKEYYAFRSKTQMKKEKTINLFSAQRTFGFSNWDWFSHFFSYFSLFRFKFDCGFHTNMLMCSSSSSLPIKSISNNACPFMVGWLHLCENANRKTIWECLGMRRKNKFSFSIYSFRLNFQNFLSLLHFGMNRDRDM